MSHNKIENFDIAKTQALKNLMNGPFNAYNAMQLVKQGANPNTKNQSEESLFKLLMTKKAVEVKALMENYSFNFANSVNLSSSYHCDLSQSKKTKALGQGTFGEVFLSTYANKEVAIKTCLISSKSTYLKTLNNFIKEVQWSHLLTEKKVPNIIEFIGVYTGLFDNVFQLCLIMEYATLGSLVDLIKTNQPLIKDSRDFIILSIINAVEAIHDLKVVCADLKSANVVLTQKEKLEVKLIDFGLMDKEGVDTCRGTAYTAAPEILNGEFNTQKSDVFSLDIIICEIITLQLINELYPLYIKTQDDISLHLDCGKRVPIPAENCSFLMEMLINACWHFDVAKRLTVKELKTMFNFTNDQIYEQLGQRLPTTFTTVCKYGMNQKLASFTPQSITYVNEIYYDGNTPLLAASASPYTHNNPELFQLLVEKDARLFDKDRVGRTALDLVFANNNKAAIEILYPHAKQLNNLNRSLMSNESIALAKQWLLETHSYASSDEAFLQKLTDINNRIEATSIKMINNAFNETELKNAISLIGFFSPYDDKSACTLVSDYFKNNTEIPVEQRALHHQQILEKLPSSYGLKARTSLLFQTLSDKDIIKKTKDKQALYDALDKVDLASFSLDKETVIKTIENYFNGPGTLDTITNLHGIRLQVREIESKQKGYNYWW